MHFDARPAWRYQWLAVVGIGAMLGAMVLTQLYGPLYLGLRLTHLVSSAAGALALYFLLLMLYRHLAWRFSIDDNNIESYQGVLARHVRSIRIDDLRNITVNQTVVQRLLGVGDVEFSGAAGSDVEVVFFGVSDPMRIKELAQGLRDKTVALAQ
jgi:uncharacterized membrane protein YdbT with pleckstrin-like domain